MSRHFVFLLFLLSPLVACGASKSTNYNTEKVSMGPFGEKKEYIISPPFEGYLFENGKALVNTTIIRSTSYNKIGDKWEDEEFQTDEKGYFNIPAKIVKMRLSFLSQFVAATEIYAVKDVEKKLFWYSHTTNSIDGSIYEQFVGEKPEGFSCDLNNEELIIKGDFSGFITRCRWSNFPSKG